MLEIVNPTSSYTYTYITCFTHKGIEKKRNIYTYIYRGKTKLKINTVEVSAPQNRFHFVKLGVRSIIYII